MNMDIHEWKWMQETDFLLSWSFEACTKVEQMDQCIWGYVEK